MGSWPWRPRPPVVPPRVLRPIVFFAVPGAEVRLEAPAGRFSTITNSEGVASFPAVPDGLTMPQANLFVTSPGQYSTGAPGYEWYGTVIAMPPDADPHQIFVVSATRQLITPLQIQLPRVVKAARLFPAEEGRLVVDGRVFRTATGAPWRWRGVSMFLLFARFVRGDDITPQLAWMTSRGINIARCWLDVPAGFRPDRYGFPHPTAYRPDDAPDFDSKLHQFFNLLAAYGIRCEFTVLTYATIMSDMRARVQRMYNIATSHWNVFIEVGNECENNGIDPVEVMRGVDRHGVVSAYGNDPVRLPDTGHWEDDIRAMGHLDYGTTHDIQRDFNHSPRLTKDVKDMQGASGIPWVEDEHVGFIDPGHPWFVEHRTDETGAAWFGAVGGGGARTTNQAIILSAAAIGYLYTPGYTLHAQCGLEGRRPSASELGQDAVARLLGNLAAFIPPESQFGDYRAPHIGDFPFVWSEQDSWVAHAYASTLGGVAWGVNPMPRPGFVFVGTNGWRLDALCPDIPYVARFVR